MSMAMSQGNMKAQTTELAKGLKTPNNFSVQLARIIVKAALNAEMENHLGCVLYGIEGHDSGNS